MGACLSCLGLRQDSNETERQHLLYNDAYAQYGTGNGAHLNQGNHGIPPQNAMSPEEARREQEALDNITRWAGEQVVEIFPHAHKITADLSGSGVSHTGTTMPHDILLSMIPGDKSKNSIRVYPASRPESAASFRSQASSKKAVSLPRSRDSSVFVPLEVDLT